MTGKDLIEIVDSPSNGMTYDCGVSREIGEDPLEVLRYFGSRDRDQTTYTTAMSLLKNLLLNTKRFFLMKVR